MTIKHIVISGGGPSGLITYGAIKHLSKEKFWHLPDIVSIYGCSIGSFIGVIISLGYEWDWLDDYFIKRPWNKVISVDAMAFIEAYNQKGVFGEKIIKDILSPLLSAKDLKTSITLKELYDFNGIDIHMYTTNINSNNINKIDISHTTHPNLELLKALHMSMAYPFIFKPICDEGNCFIDGGLLNNYPLNDCVEQTKCNTDEIMAFKNIWTSSNINNSTITQESTLIDFLIVLMKKMQCEINRENTQEEEIKYTVNCLIKDLEGIPAWINAFSSEEMRLKYIEYGVQDGIQFLSNI
jgi:predicted acylesterase/phospholipase RssA